MRLELKTEGLTHDIKKAVFLKVFFFSKGPMGTQEAPFLVRMPFQSKAIECPGFARGNRVPVRPSKPGADKASRAETVAKGQVFFQFDGLGTREAQG